LSFLDFPFGFLCSVFFALHRKLIEIMNGQSSDSDNSELSTKHRTKKTDREIKNGQSSNSDNNELSTKHRTKKTEKEIKNGPPATQTTVN
jgi:hypothetical protein